MSYRDDMEQGVDPISPRQDSLENQLRDVAIQADRMGCYDAADFIRRSVGVGDDGA